MPRPTGRGYAVLGLAAGTYLAGRVIGTWELYLFAFAFLALFVISWLMVALTGRKIQVTRSLTPDRPVAGDEPEYSVIVKNASLLPGPQMTLRTYTEGLADDDLEAEVESLGPRRRRILRTRITGVHRGVHDLPAGEMFAEDPLGVAVARHRAGEPMTVTVYPRIAPLRSCVVHPELGLKQDWAGQRGLLTSGAYEFRGIRPHQPGEPLSHIDWKTTARTGTLMIREMEEPAGSDITLLLDGTAVQTAGAAPDNNFEMAVRAAGSIADYALRMGRGVTLVRHESMRRQVRLTPDGGGRRALLEALAEARPSAQAPLGQALRGLLSDRSRPLRAQSVTLISLTLDPLLVRGLLSLREDGVNLGLVYVPGASFAEGTGLLSLGDPHGSSRGTGRAGRATRSDLPVDARALLLQLSAAGVRCVTLSRGDDMLRILSTWESGRQGRVGAAR